MKDVLTYLAVLRSGSLSGAARELSVTPSQVSKAIDRLGKDLGRKLFSRTSRGVTPTQEGKRLAPELEEILARFRRIAAREGELPRELAIAGPSFLVNACTPLLLFALRDVRIRGVELVPAQIRVHATERAFDVALLTGSEKLPPPWSSQSIGHVRKALFASPTIAKKLRPGPVSPERLIDIPFINPIYFANGQVAFGDDDCPLRRSERRGGHDATTIGLALELAARADHLVFGPVIAARAHLESGRLEEVIVEGWDVSHELNLVCHGDRVLAAAQKAMVRALCPHVIALSAPVVKARSVR